jgi:MFS family permease
MLFLSPIVFLLSLYTAVIYGYLYLLFTTMTDVFETQYNFSQGSVGLAYLGVGVGSFIGLFVLGAISDRLQQRLTTSNGGVPKPEYRLPPMFVGSWLVPVALFWYGWTAEKKDAWILPIIGTAFLGIGMIIAFVRCYSLVSLISSVHCLTFTCRWLHQPISSTPTQHTQPPLWPLTRCFVRFLGRYCH